MITFGGIELKGVAPSFNRAPRIKITPGSPPVAIRRREYHGDTRNGGDMETLIALVGTEQDLVEDTTTYPGCVIVEIPTLRYHGSGYEYVVIIEQTPTVGPGQQAVTAQGSTAESAEKPAPEILQQAAAGPDLSKSGGKGRAKKKS